MTHQPPIESNAMYQPYSIIFASVFLIFMSNAFAMNGSSSSSGQNARATLASASLTYRQQHFNVADFKTFIVNHGATLTEEDLNSAWMATRTALNRRGVDPQESILALRDYTAAMIAINKIKPNFFNSNAIATNIKTVRAYYGQPQDKKWIHIAEHRWGLCTCSDLADCNWPTLNK